jgi:hypothetical protein
MHIKSEEEKQRIREAIQRCITPDDIFAAMISFLKVEDFPLDSQKIHTAVYRVKEKFPELLAEFSFSANDVYPYSKLLEKIIFRLMASDLISYIAPDMRVGIITNESKQYIKKHILPLFDQKDQEKLAQMGRLFEEFILQEAN